MPNSSIHVMPLCKPNGSTLPCFASVNCKLSTRISYNTEAHKGSYLFCTLLCLSLSLSPSLPALLLLFLPLPLSFSFLSQRKQLVSSRSNFFSIKLPVPLFITSEAYTIGKELFPLFSLARNFFTWTEDAIAVFTCLYVYVYVCVCIYVLTLLLATLGVIVSAYVIFFSSAAACPRWMAVPVA